MDEYKICNFYLLSVKVIKFKKAPYKFTLHTKMEINQKQGSQFTLIDLDLPWKI